MPSVEIICLEQTEPLLFNNFPFIVEAEDKLVSHRGPSPLFQSDFDQLRGCIYHLGNLRGKYKPNRCYTAYDLMHKEQELDWAERIQFDPEFVPAIKSLLQELVAASPKETIIFTSDYQFGPSTRKYFKPLSLTDFWKRHDKVKLWMNAMYYLE